MVYPTSGSTAEPGAAQGAAPGLRGAFQSAPAGMRGRISRGMRSVCAARGPRGPALALAVALRPRGPPPSPALGRFASRRRKCRARALAVIAGARRGRVICWPARGAGVAWAVAPLRLHARCLRACVSWRPRRPGAARGPPLQPCVRAAPMSAGWGRSPARGFVRLCGPVSRGRPPCAPSQGRLCLRAFFAA